MNNICSLVSIYLFFNGVLSNVSGGNRTIMHILHGWQIVYRKFPGASDGIYILLSVYQTDNIISGNSLAQNRWQAIILANE